MYSLDFFYQKVMEGAKFSVEVDRHGKQEAGGSFLNVESLQYLSSVYYVCLHICVLVYLYSCI